MINNTFSGNSAGYGAGIYNSGMLTLTNNTLTSNTADFNGGGLYNHNATPTVSNTIFWGNTAIGSGPQIFNSSTGPTIGHSDIQGSGASGAGWDSTLGTDYGGNLDQDPLLGTLADNGGPTLTHALSDGSPAIDTADAATCPDTDQRGVPRPIGTGCDIGTFEYGFGEILFHTVAYDANGATSGTSPAGQTKIYNVDLILAANSGGLARTAFIFSGWNTAADGSGTHYDEGAIYATNAALILYAEWTAVSPAAIPTLSEWGIIFLALLMAGIAMVFMRKRKKMAA